MLSLATKFALTKGITVSVVMAAIGIDFWQQIIVALIGSGFTFAGVIIAARISARASEENRKRIQKVQDTLTHPDNKTRPWRDNE